MIEQEGLLSVWEVMSSLKGLCNLLCVIDITIISAWRNRFQMHLLEETQNIILQVENAIVPEHHRALCSSSIYHGRAYEYNSKPLVKVLILPKK